MCFSCHAWSAGERELAQAVFLMETCKKDKVTCDLIIESNLHAIKFFARTDEDQALMNQFLSIPHAGCLQDLTAAEVNTQLQSMYRGLDYATLGAPAMVFNSVLAAAIKRCEGQSI
jgi:hypothetical protein